MKRNQLQTTYWLPHVARHNWRTDKLDSEWCATWTAEDSCEERRAKRHRRGVHTRNSLFNLNRVWNRLEFALWQRGV